MGKSKEEQVSLCNSPKVIYHTCKGSEFSAQWLIQLNANTIASQVLFPVPSSAINLTPLIPIPFISLQWEKNKKRKKKFQ